MNQTSGVNAYDKPVENDFEYVYTENKDKAFRKVTKAMMKVLLGVATKLSELENDKNFIDNTVADLKNYYLKTETYSKEELDDKLSLIPRFSVQVVSSLPTENISDTTVYLVPSDEDEDNLYTEYINVNGLWEILGTQKVPKVEVTKELIESALGYAPADNAELDKLSATVADNATLVNGVIKFYKTGETDTELFSVDISSIGGTGGLDLNNLTLSVLQVGEYQRLSMSDGTTTKTVDIPITAISDEQVHTAVEEWLNEHPEATTTVADGSINPDKTTWLRQAFYNIFNVNTIEDGYFFYTESNANTTGGGTAAYFVSDYIPVNGGKQYYFNFVKAHVKAYDSNKTYLYTITTSTASNLIEIPNDAAYIRFSVAKNAITADTAQVYEYLGETLEYDTYKNLYNIVISNDSYKKALNEMLKQEIKNGNFDIGEAIPIENIPFEKMNGFKEWHWNIVNQDEVSQGLIWNTDGTDRYMVDSSTTIYRRTGYIPVIPNEIIYVSGYRVYAYDAEKNFVSEANTSNGILIIPDDVYYIRLSSTRADGVVPEFKAFRRGYGQTELVYNSDLKYSVYFPMFKDEIAKNGFATYLGIHPWADKKFCFIGDSFTAPGIWNRNMVDNLKGVYVGNEAISGGAFSDYDGVPKTAYEQAQNFVTNGYTPDVIMITLGTNDANNNINLGEIVYSTSISDFDLTTYTGGMQACLNYLQNNFPNAVIYIGWTPMGGLKKGGAEYIERMKEVALAYGAEYIETRTCGVTTLSAVYADCYENGINGGHPTVNGQNKIAEYMTRLMSSKN